MTNEKAVELLLEKRRELQSFIDITPKPLETYPHTVAFCEALDVALSALREPNALVLTFKNDDDPETIAFFERLTEEIKHGTLTACPSVEPSVEFVTEARGHWEEWWPGIAVFMTGEEMLYRCSACDAKYPEVEGYNFCPHCGAIMDKEGDA